MKMRSQCHVPLLLARWQESAMQRIARIVREVMTIASIASIPAHDRHDGVRHRAASHALDVLGRRGPGSIGSLVNDFAAIFDTNHQLFEIAYFEAVEAPSGDVGAIEADVKRVELRPHGDAEVEQMKSVRIKLTGIALIPSEAAQIWEQLDNLLRLVQALAADVEIHQLRSLVVAPPLNHLQNRSFPGVGRHVQGLEPRLVLWVEEVPVIGLQQRFVSAVPVIGSADLDVLQRSVSAVPFQPRLCALPSRLPFQY
mmetsp:Transcript_57447/g.131895  ORF Transcript_57447/g.131895 Transcript_57447/m.131895 type:complete len:255 (+) Transcript_57447:368-1132(+)